PEINKKLEWLDRDELIKKFVSVEFNRFTDYYRNTPDLNKPTDDRKSKGRDGDGGSNRGRARQGYSRFFLNLGNMDHIKPVDLIGMVNDFTGIRDIEIGEIDIKKTFSFFEVDSEYKDQLLTAFNSETFKDRKINLEISGKEPAKKSRSSRSDRRRGDGDKPRFKSGRKSSRGSRNSSGNSDRKRYKK
ncbi:MAG: DbpA RNA binding domain-containing protein, partial [Melioribacteraceae bacterium]|nr:DbpA RNA binding domain-containing protein [Melioribacteraceae bacterium]